MTSRGIVEATEPDDAAAAQFSLHPLAKAFVEGLSRLIYVSEQLHAFHQRECLALAARGWLAYADCIQAEKAIQFDSVRKNVVGVAKRCAAAGLHDEVITLWDRFSEALFSHSHWRDYVELDDSCLDAARALKRQDVEMTVLCELGWVLCDTTDYARAHDCLTCALKLARELNDVAAIVRAERYLATIDLRQRNYEAARAGFERLLARIPRLCASTDEQTRTRLMRQKSTLHDSLASALMELGDLDGAEAQLDIRRRIPHAINATAGARFLISQARLRTKQGCLDEAEFLLVECMQRCRELDARDAFADALMALAKVAMYRNNLSRAAGLAEEALQLFDAIGSLKREQDAKRFLSSLHTGVPAMGPLED